MYRFKFYQFVIIIKYVFKMKFCKPKKHYIPVKFHCTVDTKPKGKKQTKKKNKKQMMIYNTVITVGESKVEQGEAAVSAHVHMFGSRDV